MSAVLNVCNTNHGVAQELGCVFFHCVEKCKFLSHETLRRNVLVVETCFGDVLHVQDDIPG